LSSIMVAMLYLAVTITVMIAALVGTAALG
jgi:hypothetical protein